MSRGLWASWYDLNAVDSEAYIEWEEKEYLPSISANPRFNWVARYASKSGEGIETGVFGETVVDGAKEGIGAATQYLVLIGAESPHGFLNPLTLDGRDEYAPAMFKKRLNVRHAVFLEEETVDGPEAGPRRDVDVAALAIRFGTFNMRTPREDFDAGRWYAQRRLAELCSSPGCVGTRKLMCVAGWASTAFFMNSCRRKHAGLSGRNSSFNGRQPRTRSGLLAPRP